MTFAQSSGYGADLIASGRTALGIELGSTRIKACLVDAADPSVILAVGVRVGELVRRRSVDLRLEEVCDGLRPPMRRSSPTWSERYGVVPRRTRRSASRR
jgi:hypothetical protein